MSSNSFEISVVIATRNRQESLQRTLDSLSQQTLLPKEIIIVDASDSRPSVKIPTSAIPVKWLFTRPSVCAQRNLGIREACTDWIFICDDDIELERNHFFDLSNYCENNSFCAAAGLLLQKEKEKWVKNYPVTKISLLIWRFIFQQSIWGEIHVNASGLSKPIINILKSFYRKRGNFQTLAGWPLITDWNETGFKTKFFSLGATLIKKEWLLASPFDEALDSHGIGDNYGVALKFPGMIHVLSSTYALHHKAEENRLSEVSTRTKRILALNYFQRKNLAGIKTRAFFFWSLIGFICYSLLRDRKNFIRYVKTFLNCLKSESASI